MRMFVMAALVTAAGCRLNFAEHADDDASDAPAGDAVAGLGPFGTPVPVAELNAANQQDDDPCLTEDQLEVIFDSSRGGGSGTGRGDAWKATRASVAQPFGTPTLVTELASTGDDTTFDLSPDGLTMYFGSDRLVTDDRDLYVTTRADRASPWSAPQRITELESSAEDDGTCQSADGLTLIFSSARGGDADFYTTTRPTIGATWSTPVRIPELATPEPETQPWCNRDLTIIYFTRGLPGDIYYATRSDPYATWSTPLVVPEFATTANEADPWLSPDLRTIYLFIGDLAGGHIYRATR